MVSVYLNTLYQLLWKRKNQWKIFWKRWRLVLAFYSLKKHTIKTILLYNILLHSDSQNSQDFRKTTKIGFLAIFVDVGKSCKLCDLKEMKMGLEILTKSANKHYQLVTWVEITSFFSLNHKTGMIWLTYYCFYILLCYIIASMGDYSILKVSFPCKMYVLL